ncbi:MAG: hypothetical protein HY617_03880 [Candidatus Sungbacteria bacterium]|nr:hypothetical protein [Candidatus Sungbacteria bacterium]
MRQILYLILALLIMAAIGILIPFRAYGENFADLNITEFQGGIIKFSDSAKHQGAKRQPKHGKTRKDQTKINPPQSPLLRLEQTPAPKPKFSPFLRPLHPIRRA